jgi:hypothetical protein
MAPSASFSGDMCDTGGEGDEHHFESVCLALAAVGHSMQSCLRPGPGLCVLLFET